MRKTIEIGGKPCELKSSAAIPRMYRIKFGRDIFVDLLRLQKELSVQEKLRKELKEKAEAEGRVFEEDEFSSGMPVDALELFENIAFIMNVHGDPNQPRDIEEWLEQFEMFDVYEILPVILQLWGLETKELSEPKKENEK